jgi:hypothetical protein
MLYGLLVLDKSSVLLLTAHLIHVPLLNIYLIYSFNLFCVVFYQSDIINTMQTNLLCSATVKGIYQTFYNILLIETLIHSCRKLA